MQRAFAEDREVWSRRRRFHLMIVGAGVSLLIHLCILFFLSLQIRPGLPTKAGAEVAFDFTILSEEDLTQLEPTDLDDLLPEAISEDLASTDDLPVADLDPVISSAELEVANQGARPTLGGSGAGSGAAEGMAAGGAGASFFGVTSSGRRFAWIVDRSGSMGQEGKLEAAMNELARSVSSLPDFAQFHVVLFSNQPARPPMQNGWMVARPAIITRFIRWLGQVGAEGGTQPGPAFERVFNLDVRPDVIFFLTDGKIPPGTAALVASLNDSGSRVVVNTIAFGSDASQDQLEEIARTSGGAYRFVKVGGG